MAHSRSRSCHYASASCGPRRFILGGVGPHLNGVAGAITNNSNIGRHITEGRQTGDIPVGYVREIDDHSAHGKLAMKAMGKCIPGMEEVVCDGSCGQCAAVADGVFSWARIMIPVPRNAKLSSLESISTGPTA